jgi:hypothetical protein
MAPHLEAEEDTVIPVALFKTFPSRPRGLAEDKEPVA